MPSSLREAGQCRLVDRRRIADGEEILVDGRYQSFVIEHASDDILYLPGGGARRLRAGRRRI